MSDGWAIAAAIATIVAAAISWWYAHKASRASADADKAQQETQRLAGIIANAATQQASAQTSIATSLARPLWGPARHVSGDLYAIRNGTGTSAHVFSVVGSPAAAASLVTPRAVLPTLVRGGDELRVFVEARLSLSVHVVSIEWSTDANAEHQTTEVPIG